MRRRRLCRDCKLRYSTLEINLDYVNSLRTPEDVADGNLEALFELVPFIIEQCETELLRRLAQTTEAALLMRTNGSN